MTGLLVIDGGGDLQQQVQSALDRAPELGLVADSVADLEQALPRLAEPSLVAALVNLGSDPGAALRSLEPIVARFPDTRFLVTCVDPDLDLLTEAMQVGARFCLKRSDLAEKLVPSLRRVLESLPQDSARAGSVFTVLSAGGGAGGTTVSINLAQELGAGSDAPALLVDLDPILGTTANCLGVKGPYGVSDVLGHKGDIDGELVRSTSISYSADIHLLLGPASLEEVKNDPLEGDGLRELLLACRKGYAHTVIDAPRLPIRQALELASLSDRTLVLFEMSVPGIRTAKALARLLTEAGIPRERILLINNRHRKRKAMLSLNDAKNALEGYDLKFLSNDHESALKVINLGQPLSKVAPRSALRKDIRGLATLLAGEPAS